MLIKNISRIVHKLRFVYLEDRDIKIIILNKYHQKGSIFLTHKD